jgi:hypothetical protein
MNRVSIGLTKYNEYPENAIDENPDSSSVIKTYPLNKVQQ